MKRASSSLAPSEKEAVPLSGRGAGGVRGRRSQNPSRGKGGRGNNNTRGKPLAPVPPSTTVDTPSRKKKHQENHDENEGRGENKDDRATDVNPNLPMDWDHEEEGVGDDSAETAATAASATLQETKYKQLSLREQILLRPGMWVGSTLPDTCSAWLYDESQRRMVRRDVTYVPAFLKIFDEILMNALDHATNQKAKKARNPNADVSLVRNIRVSIATSSSPCDDVDATAPRGRPIEIVNDGDGIPVDKNENGIYYPELIFGHLLTSSNYDDEAQNGVHGKGRIVGGQNGIGAKACNIYSERFEVETVDRFRRRVYAQTFEDNMSVIRPPTVAYCAKKGTYTRVRFVPDYARLGMRPDMGDEAYRMLVKRVYDAAAITDPDVAVHLNGAKLECNSFEKFVDLHLMGGGEGDGGGVGPAERVYEKVNDWWEVAAACSDGNGLQQVSFVNGVCTFRGGKHVDHVVDRIVRKLSALIRTKRASAAAAAAADGGNGIKPAFVRDNLFVFVKATIPNPSFVGQCKDTLSTPVSEFGAKVDVSDRFVEKLYKSGIVERVMTLNDATTGKSLSKTDGKKQSSVAGIPKLDDANWAGGAKSKLCTLILTEGDSAKTMAISGISAIPSGRDRFGVFPLRGKVMNVCDMQGSRIAANQEITNLKKILGLEAGRQYADVDALRYGRIMIMTDQDVDGSHIKGLLFNLFHQLWPSLLTIDGFMTSMLTPIVKASRPRHPTIEFFSLTDFDAWRAQAAVDLKHWSIKYYKGLGTSTREEARRYFCHGLKMARYVWHDARTSGDALDLAFNKSRAHHRKEWLQKYDKTAGLDHGEAVVSYEDFVNRDLIHFSNYDVERSIPNVCDGFKISQRKIMFGCLKKNLVKGQMKVAQLAGYVGEHSAYHHGEASLNATIVGMAQDFVGANNVNVLLPIGQFGSRIQGGRDSAATRYIHTQLSPVAPLLFRSEDNTVLTFLDEDGQQVEPEFYLPVLPMVLLNGALGIGTGFSTNVPCYNPLDVADLVRRILEFDERSRERREDGKEEAEPDPASALAGFVAALPEIKPWYRDFGGTIETVEDGTANGSGSGSRYVSRGVYKRTKAAEVVVTELPIGYWTDDFKELVDGLKQSTTEIKDVRHNHSDTTVACAITFSSPAAADAWTRYPDDSSSSGGGVRQTKLEKALKLVSNKHLATNFMYLFNHERRIQKYDSVNDILREYYAVRVEAYGKRKRILLDTLRSQADVLQNKIRFLQEVIDETVVIHKKSKDDLERELAERAYLRVDDAYDYLTRLPLSSLTSDRKRALDAQLEGIRVAVDETERTSERQMWRRELDAFCEKYIDLNKKRVDGKREEEGGGEEETEEKGAAESGRSRGSSENLES